MPFESFPNFFLKLKLKKSYIDEDGIQKYLTTDATGKNYYQILGIENKGLVGKSVERNKNEKRIKKTRNIRDYDGIQFDKDNIDAYLAKLRNEGKEVKISKRGPLQF